MAKKPLLWHISSTCFAYLILSLMFPENYFSRSKTGKSDMSSSYNVSKILFILDFGYINTYLIVQNRLILAMTFNISVF